MLKEVYKNVFLNHIDLPKNPLKYLNSFIILSGDRPLIIDTGFNRPECKESFYDGINKLDIDLKNTDVLITHLHSDHCGLIGELEKQGASIIMGEIEAEAINALSETTYWDVFKQNAKMFDLEEDAVKVEHHPGYTYRPEPVTNYTAIKDKDVLTVGDFNLQIMHVPGHTPGHIALYEPDKKLFFGSDLILDDITPTITFWGFEYGNILQVYFDSLNKVDKLDIDLLLTGHRVLITDHKKRVTELLKHHEERLEELKNILDGKKLTVRESASKMKWDIRAKSWADFPKAQKWFATGEAMAHLEYLYLKGMAQREDSNGKLLYSIK